MMKAASRMSFVQVNHVPCACGISIIVYALIGMPILTDFFVGYVVRTPPFRLTDGDLVHCIAIQDLVGRLPNPTMSWRLAPTLQPRYTTSSSFSTFQPIKQAVQLMVAENQICPAGAVPSRSRPGIIVYFIRILGSKAYPKAKYKSVVHLLMAGGAHHHPEVVQRPASAALWPNDHDNHKYAVADIVGPYRGTQGRLSIWHPHVGEKEFSLAQVWVSSIDANGRLHSLEAGWQVYRELYSDSKPRLFIYWTADDYSSTGCYNLHCPGFVQVSSKWLLGGSFAEISTLESRFLYEVKIHIFKDRGTGDWWLQLQDENVGYWPKGLFGRGAFTDSNTKIDWGGEIWHRRGYYTDTQMGNGNHPAFSAHLRVAYVRNLLVINHHDFLQDPPPKTPTAFSTYGQCCSLIVHGGPDNNRTYRSSWGNYMYFGGPGFNPDCVREKPPE